MAIQTHRLQIACDDATNDYLRARAKESGASISEIIRQLVKAATSPGDQTVAFDVANIVHPDYYDILAYVATANKFSIANAIEALAYTYIGRPDVLKYYEEHPASRDLTKHEPPPPNEPVRVYIETWAVDRLRHRAKLLGWSLGKYLAVFVQVCILQYKKDKVERSGYRPELTE